MENLEKNCSYKVMGFKLSKLCSGVGNLFSFLDPGGQSFALKSCTWTRDFDRKNSGLGGMATGQIDT